MSDQKDYYKVLLTLSKTPDKSLVLENFTNALEEALNNGLPIDYCSEELNVSLLSAVLLYFNNNWSSSIRFEGFTPDFVKILIEHNANVNIKDQNGWTPLMFAATIEKEYSINTLKILLNHPAIDVNLSNEDEETVLDIICKNYIFYKGVDKSNEAFKLEKIKLLVEAGGRLKKKLDGDKERVQKLERFIASYKEQKKQLEQPLENMDWDYEL